MNRIRRFQTAALSMLLVAAALPVEAGTAQCERPRYRLIDLGTFGGPASYFPNGFDGILNDLGTAVGWANTSSPDPFDPFCADPDNCFVTHAFRVQNGKVADLGTLPGGINSQAFWINKNGLIAGFSDNGQLDPGVPGMPQRHAVLWRHGQIVDLGTHPDGGLQSGALAVNDRGQVVGFAINNIPDSSLGLSGQLRAFLWQDGVMRDLGTLGSPDASANFINDRGEVVGSSFTTIDPATGFDADLHAFFWKDGKMQDLGTLGGTDSEPTALNERGEVVGSSTLAGDTITHPFLWSQGHMKDLGTLGGDSGTTEYINDYGEVVGKADLPGPTPQLHDPVVSHQNSVAQYQSRQRKSGRGSAIQMDC